jgi:hypothetical protein
MAVSLNRRRGAVVNGVFVLVSSTGGGIDTTHAPAVAG